MSNYRTIQTLTIGDTFTHGGARYTVTVMPRTAEMQAHTTRMRMVVGVTNEFDGDMVLTIPVSVPLKLV